MNSQIDIDHQLTTAKQEYDKSIDIFNKYIEIIKYKQNINTINNINEILYQLIIINKQYNIIDINDPRIINLEYDNLEKYFKSLNINRQIETQSINIFSNLRYIKPRHVKVMNEYFKYSLMDLICYDDKYYLKNDKKYTQIETLEQLSYCTNNLVPLYNYNYNTIKLQDNVSSFELKDKSLKGLYITLKNNNII